MERDLSTRPNPNRPLRRLISLATAIAVAWAIALTALIWAPITHAPHRVDAVVVLGVPRDRLDAGISLIDSGYANVLVVSSPDPTTDPERVPSVCPSRVDAVEVICFTPHPFTTVGEALELARLAELHGWNDVIIVTYRSHVRRAQWYFDQCAPHVNTSWIAYDRELDPAWVLDRYLYEGAAWAKAAATWGCPASE